MENISKFNAEIRRKLTIFLDKISGAAIIKNRLSIKDGLVFCDTEELDLNSSKHIFILAIGKAASSMSSGFVDVIGASFKGSISGLIITKEGHGLAIGNLQVMESSHPIPSQNSLKSARAVRMALSSLDSDCQVVILLSGGGSALMCEPIDGISFEEKQSLHKLLVESGASIEQINRVRIALSKVKGGRLAPLLGNRKALALVLSDVIGNDLAMVSSGPFFLRRYDEPIGAMLRANKIILPPDLQGRIERLSPSLENNYTVPHILLADNQWAVKILASTFDQNDFTVVMEEPLISSVEETAELLVERYLFEKKRRCASFILLGGGESTLKVKGVGLGGRNMHLCCLLAWKLLDRGVRDFGLFSLGTDGTDGPTDAAGGILHSQSFNSEAVRRKLKVAIEAQNTYPFLESNGSLIKTGPTGTNLNDIHGLISF